MALTIKTAQHRRDRQIDKPNISENSEKAYSKMEMNKQQSCPFRSTGKDVLWCGVIDCLIIYVEKKWKKIFSSH